MFILKIYSRKLRKSRETRFNDFETIKEIIIKIYNNFVYLHPCHTVEFTIKDIYDESPLEVCIKETTTSGTEREYIEINVNRVSETEVNNEQFFKDLGINLDD